MLVRKSAEAGVFTERVQQILTGSKSLFKTHTRLEVQNSSSLCIVC